MVLLVWPPSSGLILQRADGSNSFFAQALYKLFLLFRFVSGFFRSIPVFRTGLPYDGLGSDYGGGLSSFPLRITSATNLAELRGEKLSQKAALLSSLVVVIRIPGDAARLPVR